MRDFAESMPEMERPPGLRFQWLAKHQNPVPLEKRRVRHPKIHKAVTSEA
jgi:hypothetical protein